MPRISHKKATTLSCILIDEDRVTGLAKQVDEFLNEELRRNGSDSSCSTTSTCTVSAAVKRLLPLVSCPLQPQDLLQRCAVLHLPDASPTHGAEGSVVCVATAAAACTVMWSVMLEGVGDVVQRGILKILGGYSYRQTVEKAGSLVLLDVALQNQEQGEEAEVASSSGLPASIDLLLCDDIGRKLAISHMHHVIGLLCAAAGQALYRHGTRDVNSDISSAGMRAAAVAPSLRCHHDHHRHHHHHHHDHHRHHYHHRSQVTTSSSPPFEESCPFFSTSPCRSSPMPRSSPSARSALQSCPPTISHNFPKTHTKLLPSYWSSRICRPPSPSPPPPPPPPPCQHLLPSCPSSSLNCAALPSRHPSCRPSPPSPASPLPVQQVRSRHTMRQRAIQPKSPMRVPSISTPLTRAPASLLPLSEMFAKHATAGVAQGSSSSILAIIIVDNLALSLSQSQAPDVVESVLFTLADICCRMRAHAAQAVADVMAAVALSRGSNVAVEVHDHAAPTQSYVVRFPHCIIVTLGQVRQLPPVTRR
jgi:hypothetical protein